MAVRVSRTLDTPMRFRFRRLLAVLLLPLILGAFPGWTDSGGWFCADGQQCEPAAALTCCCAATAPCTGSRCDEPGVPAATLSAGPCGCYYDAQAQDAGLRVEKPFLLLVAAPPPHPFTLAPPTTRLVTRGILRAPVRPPRWISASPDPRGPPVA
jgi:hypothetical protein